MITLLCVAAYLVVSAFVGRAIYRYDVSRPGVTGDTADAAFALLAGLAWPLTGTIYLFWLWVRS